MRYRLDKNSETFSLQDTLDFSCLCQNGSAPDLAAYQQSMPSFICQEAYAECISQTNDLETQTGCVTNIQNNCGNLTISAPSPTTASGSGSSATGSSSSGSSAAASSSSHAAAPTNMAQYGNGAAAVVAIGLLAYLV